MVEPKPIEEAVSLINRGEYSEALQVFRKMHGIVNRFQCNDCNVITDETAGFECLYCGGEVGTIAVQAKGDE